MIRTVRVLILVVVCALSWSGGRDVVAQSASTDDPIAREVGEWRARLADPSRTDSAWMTVKTSASAALDVADLALKSGRRWAALERLAAARAILSAAQYVGERSAETRRSVAAFETEWKRMAGVLGPALKPPASSSFAAVQPAAVRAFTEAAGFQIKVHYDASIEYGRATDADSGLFYLGSAQANQQFLSFARSIGGSTGAAVPALRSLAQETDALETALLAVYRPPVSIDRHAEFIAASSALKEARELDAAGLHFGALQRYLLAVQRTALLQSSPASDAGAIRARLQSFESRVNDRSKDHTIASIYLERAFTELDRAEPPPAAIALAAVVADDVLPKYFAAFEPPVAATSPAKQASVTVTLVRWPFT